MKAQLKLDAMVFAGLAAMVAIPSVVLVANSESPERVLGSKFGVTIMGSIIQSNAAENVALIKESTGSVKAVKKGYRVLEKYLVTLVTPKYIEVQDQSKKRILVLHDKFAGDFKTASKSAAGGGQNDYFAEEGFERRKGDIKMSAEYRDKLVKQDLAKVLMQATAEPYMEGGGIAGFMVSQIDKDSIYDKAGLQNGDIITNINGTELTSIAGAIALLKSLKGADSLDVKLRRGDSMHDYSVNVNN